MFLCQILLIICVDPAFHMPVEILFNYPMSSFTLCGHKSDPWWARLSVSKQSCFLWIVTDT